MGHIVRMGFNYTIRIGGCHPSVGGFRGPKAQPLSIPKVLSLMTGGGRVVSRPAGVSIPLKVLRAESKVPTNAINSASSKTQSDF
jgi:hypothetical protein